MTDAFDRLKAALADRYTIERELGAGGMATVYLAHDLKHDRQVALKVMRPELATVMGAERFVHEIKTTANFHHPNILQLYDSGEVVGFLFYVMPVVDGESLRGKLDREKQLAIEDAVKIATAVAEALDYAHRHEVIHRDIKPENILLHEGTPMVADFGIAFAVSRAAGERITETGLSLGTPSYMSPEQATGDRGFDARSDVYALGCVLYEMLAGDPPFTGSNMQALLAKVISTDPVPLRKIRETVPKHVEVAVTTALAKVPADRHTTARQFAEALTSWDTTVPIDVQAATPSRRRPAAIIAFSALVVLVSYLAVQSIRGTGVGTEPVRATYSQLTTEPGVEMFPSLSPDGRWIVYSGDGLGNRDIYLKSVGGQNPINLTADSPADDDHPAFSPDGEQIAFWSGRDGGGIFIMGRTGEAVRRVTRAGFRPTWSPDGTQLAYVMENVDLNPQNGEGMGQLWVIQVNQGEPRQLDVEDAVLPSWSPHGHRIAFMARVGQSTEGNVYQGDIWTVRASGSEPRAVTSHLATDWNPVWSPDGRYLYFASDRSGSMNLWRVAIDEESGETLAPPEPITTPATSLAHMSVSGDGRSIAYSSVLVTVNIQSQKTDPSTGTPIGQPTWVTTGSRRWVSPDPSPDGERIAFYSLSQPEGHVYVAGTDGTGLRRVTGDSAVDRVTRWSPKGDWIAFFSNRGGPLDIWKIRPDGSDLTQVTSNRGTVPAWSPDAERIAACVASEDSRSVMLFDPARSWEEQEPQALTIPDDTLAEFCVNSWSPDGERLAGQPSFSDAGIIIYTFRTGGYERLTDFGEWPVWLPDGKHLLFVSGGKEFFVVNVETKEVRSVFSVDRDVIGPPRLSLDGREMYFSRRVTEADIWILTLAGAADGAETSR
jgi:Tol biopolymer transport system component